MKFTTAFFTQLALATAILAAPQPVSVPPVLREDTTSPFAVARRQRREAAFALKSDSKPVFDVKPVAADAEDFNETYSVVYSSNWAGAVLTSPPSGTTFKSVTGTWNVPTLSKGTGSGPWYVAEWVGIDGYTYDAAILQAGVLGEVTTSGSQAAEFWVEWYPNALSYVTSVSVSPGDTVTVTVTATSTTTGTVLLDNVTTGKSTTVTISAPSSSAALGGENAEWIVEDVSSGSSLVPFGDFSTVYFTDTVATTSSGSTEGVSGATVVDIEQNGEVLATTVIISNTEVEVYYSG